MKGRGFSFWLTNHVGGKTLPIPISSHKTPLPPIFPPVSSPAFTRSRPHALTPFFPPAGDA
ncbi:hypothetical protein E2C01_067161 [Portunus trituberculatus]|uniref:Uncharacterized protein n=1 Tax=Portunus trituberculatus TaxID=210409 RepID=A0A5B7HUA3_PORTR|nr:hypothetical protein [Portunus trituberculatus]